MKLRLDENPPESLAAELAALGYDVDTVRQEGLAGRCDPGVRAAAQAASRFLLTQDLDFSDVRKFRPGTHHGLLLVRLPEAGRLALTLQVAEAFRVESVEAWQGGFVVLRAHKLRVIQANND